MTSGSANYHETQTTVVVEFVSGALSDELREDGWKCFLLLFQTVARQERCLAAAAGADSN